MNLREQTVNLGMEVEEDEIEANSPQIQALLKQFAEDTTKKRTVKETSEKPDAVVQKITRKKNSAEIRQAILVTEQEITDLEANITKEMNAAEGSLAGAPAEFAKAKAKFEKQKIELLKSESSTKLGKEALISHYKSEIERLENDLQTGDFIDEFSDKFQKKYAFIKQRHLSKMQEIQKLWVDWAYDKYNITIEGNVEEGKKKKRGMKEMLVDLQKRLELLKANLEEAIIREKMTPKDKDSGSVMKMVDQVMQDEENLDEFMDSKMINSSKDEIAAMMEETTISDEMEDLLNN